MNKKEKQNDFYCRSFMPDLATTRMLCRQWSSNNYNLIIWHHSILTALTGVHCIFFLFFTCIHVNCPIRLHVSSIPCHIHWPMWLYIFEQWPCPMFMAASHLILTDLIDAIKWLRQHDKRSVSLSMVHDRACMLYICRLQVLFTIVRQINYDNINL